MLTQACIVISLWLERGSRRQFRALDAQVLARGGRGGVPVTSSLPPTPSELLLHLLSPAYLHCWEMGSGRWEEGKTPIFFTRQPPDASVSLLPNKDSFTCHLLYMGALKINEKIFLNTLKAPRAVVV